MKSEPKDREVNVNAGEREIKTRKSTAGRSLRGQTLDIADITDRWEYKVRI